jgi:hypothetical protein
MSDDKKLLDLVFNSEKAPKEVTAAAKKHHENLKALDKARSEMKQAKLDSDVASAAVEDSGIVLEKVLASWKQA